MAAATATTRRRGDAAARGGRSGPHPPGPTGVGRARGPDLLAEPDPTAGADIGSDINGGTRADPGTDAAPALGATAAPGGLGVVALAPRLGAAQVPPGLVGMSLPLLDPTMASRLRVGDIVDAYATGRKSPVARAARVIDVIAVTTSDLGVSGDDTGASGARVGAAYVFVAVEKTDASRNSAGRSRQRRDHRPSTLTGTPNILVTGRIQYLRLDSHVLEATFGAVCAKVLTRRRRCCPGAPGPQKAMARTFPESKD